MRRCVLCKREGALRHSSPHPRQACPAAGNFRRRSASEMPSTSANTRHCSHCFAGAGAQGLQRAELLPIPPVSFPLPVSPLAFLSPLLSSPRRAFPPPFSTTMFHEIIDPCSHPHPTLSPPSRHPLTHHPSPSHHPCPPSLSPPSRPPDIIPPHLTPPSRHPPDILLPHLSPPSRRPLVMPSSHHPLDMLF